MNTTRKPLARLALAIAAVAATTAFATSPAMAQQWSSATVKATGQLQLTAAGKPTLNCTYTATYSGLAADLPFSCNGIQTTQHAVWMLPDSGSSVGMYGFGYSTSPWGSASWDGSWGGGYPFVAGNASTPSRYTLSNAVIGLVRDAGGERLVYATGTVTVTTPSGGLVTIVP